MVTGPTVTESYIENPCTVFHDWVKQNYRALSQQNKDIRAHGLWVITKIVQTPKCAISSWSGSEESISLYLGASAFMGGALTLGGAIGVKESSGIVRFLPEPEEESSGIWRCITSRLNKKVDKVSHLPSVHG